MSGNPVTAIDVWRDNHVAIVEPLANLHAYDARNLTDAIREAQAMTLVSAVIVTLDSAVLVDADAVDVLLKEHRAYQDRGGRIVLCNVSAPVRRLLELSAVSNFLRIYQSLEDALRELGPQ